MDITAFRDLGSLHARPNQMNTIPTAVAQKKKIFQLLDRLEGANIKANFEQFTSFHNRFYRSECGAKSAEWLLDLISSTTEEAGADKFDITVTAFDHEWAQHSIILSIPGKSNSTIVIGAYLDNANYLEPMDGRAPDILEGRAENTIEFHWYSAEEPGLLGSQDVFRQYEKTGRDIKAMLQQDMTGFTYLTVGAGRKPEFGIVMDKVDNDLANYMKLIIDEYTDISWVETTCGRCGSDHMSAIKAGYPAIYVFESDFTFGNNHVHTPYDLVEYLNFDHAIDHARMTFGFVYELAFAEL